MKENTPDQIKNQAIDYVASGAKALLGSVPFAGSLLVEIAGVIIPRQRLDRIAEFAGELESRIKHLEESRVCESLADETFTELVEEALKQASRSTSKDRRQYLASLVADSLTKEEATHNDRRHLLRMLGEINDVEVIILRSFLPTSMAEREEFRKIHKELLTPARTNLGSPSEEIAKRAIQNSYIDHLTALGLLSRALKLDKNKQPFYDSSARDFAYLPTAITPLGRILLRTIGLEPIKKPGVG